MKQIPKPPSIINCYCGDKAEVFECDDLSIGYYNTWQVMCDRNHTMSKYCGSMHRAICLWNNRVATKITAYQSI